MRKKLLKVLGFIKPTLKELQANTVYKYEPYKQDDIHIGFIGCIKRIY
jgi:hypothetical protein